MNRKIDIAYVLTAGSYDDYHIEAIFLDKKLAERVLKECEKQSPEGYSLEDWPIDEVVKKIYWWRVDKDINTGKLDYSRKLSFGSFDVSVIAYIVEENKYHKAYIQAYGKTEKEAIKNAEDFRKQYLAGQK